MRCPQCGEEMEFRIVDEILGIGGQTHRLEAMRGMFCPNRDCGEGIWEPESYDRWVKAQAELVQLAKKDQDKRSLERHVTTGVIMKIIPATETSCATIEFSEEDEKRIQEMVPMFLTYDYSEMLKKSEITDPQDYNYFTMIGLGPVDSSLFATYPASIPIEKIYTQDTKMCVNDPRLNVPASPMDYEDAWYTLFDTLSSHGESHAVSIMREMDPSLQDDEQPIPIPISKSLGYCSTCRQIVLWEVHPGNIGVCIFCGRQVTIVS
jgi:YgiT-type zinc finger domain-containing protein